MEFDTPLSYAIKVNILSDDKIIRDICSAYWALNISSPSFKKPFLYSVKTISEKYQIKPTRILPLVQKNCISVLIGLKCIKCGKNYPLKKRQNYNEAFSFYVESNDFSNEWICKECEKKAEEEAWAERRKISDKDFAYVRQVQRENMPSFMKNFELEIKKRIKPCVHKMTKTEYIHAWCMFFNDNDDMDDIVKNFSKYTYYHLEKAFTWTCDHFAELDLGGNYKWLTTTEYILNYLRKSIWNLQTETKLIKSLLIDTRWFD